MASTGNVHIEAVDVVRIVSLMVSKLFINVNDAKNGNMLPPLLPLPLPLL